MIEFYKNSRKINKISINTKNSFNFKQMMVKLLKLMGNSIKFENIKLLGRAGERE